MKTVKLPMTLKEWEKVGLPIEGKSLMSSLSLVEAELLELIERKQQPLFLIEALEKVDWPEPIVLMAVGGLIREKLIIAKRSKNRIVLSRNRLKK